MEKVEHEKDTGLVVAKSLKKYGQYTFLEKVKLGGSGSEELFYVSGSEYLDEVIEGKEGKPVVKFEIMKKALFVNLTIQEELFTLAVITKNLKAVSLIPNNHLVLHCYKDGKIDKLMFKIPKDLLAEHKTYFSKTYFDKCSRNFI